jgi:hypothetical protein
LEDDADSSDKPTEVRIVRLREQLKEHAWTFTVNVVEGLPGLIAARDLFLRISRGPTKRSRQISSSACDGLTMRFPDVSSKYSPGPVTRTIMSTSIWPSTPEIEEESRQIDKWLVHHITRKTSREREDARYPTENTRLSDTSIVANPFVFAIVSRGNDVQ